MKLIGAGLFAVTSMMLIFVAVGSFMNVNERRDLVLISFPIIAVIFGLAVYAAYYLFNSWENRPIKWWKPFHYPTIEEMEEKGLVETQIFHARRAFQVEEYEDEGLHYFLELEDGSVLYLSGQYLYDYEEIDDEPEYSQPKTFPCEKFVIKRHKKYGYVLAIETQGKVLNPETILPPFLRYYARKPELPKDGDIIRDHSFDDIKALLENNK